MSGRFKHLQVPTNFEIRQKTLSYRLEIQFEAMSCVLGEKHALTEVARNLLCDWKDNLLAQEKLDELISALSDDLQYKVGASINEITFKDAQCPSCGGPR